MWYGSLCFPQISHIVREYQIIFKYIQSSSPDELALVHAAARLGVVFAGRVGSTLTLEFPLPSRLRARALKRSGESDISLESKGSVSRGPSILGQDRVAALSYEVLDTIAFTSERRRMSVLVRSTSGIHK